MQAYAKVYAHNSGVKFEGTKIFSIRIVVKQFLPTSTADSFRVMLGRIGTVREKESDLVTLATVSDALYKSGY